jgi:hypothetical protein
MTFIDAEAARTEALRNKLGSAALESCRSAIMADINTAVSRGHLSVRIERSGKDWNRTVLGIIARELRAAGYHAKVKRPFFASIRPFALVLDVSWKKSSQTKEPFPRVQK